MAVYRARYVFPVCGPPIPDGEVRVEGERIVAVGPSHGPAAAGTVDLGNTAILPGLVNAHVHLELSGFASPLGRPGIGMAEWIRLVMAQRRSGDHDAATAVSAGLAECHRCGTAAAGDIVQGACPLLNCSESDIAITSFLELIGPTSQRAEGAIALAREWAAQDFTRPNRKGLSPHAPYTVLPELLREAVALSASARLLLAMHLAESLEEIELLRSCGGPLRRLLDELDAWSPELLAVGPRPLDYLKALAPAHRVAVIHGNHLDDTEIAFLGAHAAHMSVVYCPRSHAHFCHPAYPLAAMLDAGVSLALGTDSRASAPDLNLLEEMRFAAAQHPGVSREAILRMATLGAARAIGQEDFFGSIAPGKSGRLSFLPLPEGTAADPHHLLVG